MGLGNPTPSDVLREPLLGQPACYTFKKVNSFQAVDAQKHHLLAVVLPLGNSIFFKDLDFPYIFVNLPRYEVDLLEQLLLVILQLPHHY